MKAIQATEYGSSDVLELIEMDIPPVGPDQVLIRTEAVGVNFADVLQRRGDYRGGPEAPFVPGMEVSGVIEEVGENVDRDVGERVVAMVNDGTYAEYIVVSKYSLFDVPESMDVVTAAGFPVQFLTAHSILHEWGELEADERVLIHAAAGGVGSAAVQIADVAGAEIFATASTAEKLDLAERLGADHCINYTETAFEDEVLEITDGEGVDLVLDGVGGDVFHASLDALAHFGRIVPYGDASGVVPTVDTGRLRYENKTVIGFHLGQAMQHDYRRVLSSKPDLLELLNSGRVEITVGETFPLEAAADAHESLENRENIGKVVLTT